jgi:hypothetical protein
MARLPDQARSRAPCAARTRATASATGVDALVGQGRFVISSSSRTARLR